MRVLRSRAPEQVRRDALNVADRKATEGCMPCAETYLSVAEQHGASPAEVDRTRRRLFRRAGALAGVGLAASLVDVGALVRAAAAATPRNPLGGWIADPQQVAPALLNSAAYADARNHLLREGVDVGQDGAFMLLPASNPLGQAAYTLVQPFAGGVLQVHLTQNGQSVAVATLDGRSQFAAHYDGARRLALKTAPFAGQAGRGQLPGGRLLPPPGARLQVGSGASSVPAASAATCDVACVLLWGTGCWAFCFFLTGWAGVVCGIVYCGVAGTYVCNTICA
jgi:hypothetical protein